MTLAISLAKPESTLNAVFRRYGHGPTQRGGKRAEVTGGSQSYSPVRGTADPGAVAVDDQPPAWVTAGLAMVAAWSGWTRGGVARVSAQKPVFRRGGWCGRFGPAISTAPEAVWPAPDGARSHRGVDPRCCRRPLAIVQPRQPISRPGRPTHGPRPCPTAGLSGKFAAIINRERPSAEGHPARFRAPTHRSGTVVNPSAATPT